MVRRLSVISYRITKILAFIHKHLHRFFRNLAETAKKLWFYFGSKITKPIFFNFFITQSSNFIFKLNDNFFWGFFLVNYNFVSQKLMILEFLSKIFSLWPRSLWKPPEANLCASVTSLRSQILAEDVSFHLRYCLLRLDKNWSIQWPLSLSGSVNYMLFTRIRVATKMLIQLFEPSYYSQKESDNKSVQKFLILHSVTLMTLLTRFSPRMRLEHM